MMVRIAFVKSLLVFSLASSVFVLTAEAIRCYSCEMSSSEVSYVDAEKRCNSRGPSDCQNPQHKACMTEAFTTKRESTSSSSSSSSSSPSFNVVKKCMSDCPVFVNSTAEHIRCCLETACNNLIFIETVDESTAQPRQGRQLPEGSPLPSSSSEDQSLPPPDNEDERPPSMMRPNTGGRFPPPGPNDPGRRHAPPQLQQQPMPGPPGGMRPPPPPPEMGDERQRHGGGPGAGSGNGGRGGAGAGGGGSSSNGIKSASSRLSFPSLIHLVVFVVASSSVGMNIPK